MCGLGSLGVDIVVALLFSLGSALTHLLGRPRSGSDDKDLGLELRKAIWNEGSSLPFVVLSVRSIGAWMIRIGLLFYHNNRVKEKSHY